MRLSSCSKGESDFNKQSPQSLTALNSSTMSCQTTLGSFLMPSCTKVEKQRRPMEKLIQRKTEKRARHRGLSDTLLTNLLTPTPPTWTNTMEDFRWQSI